MMALSSSSADTGLSGRGSFSSVGINIGFCACELSVLGVGRADVAACSGTVSGKLGMLFLCSYSLLTVFLISAMASWSLSSLRLKLSLRGVSVEPAAVFLVAMWPLGCTLTKLERTLRVRLLLEGLLVAPSMSMPPGLRPLGELPRSGVVAESVEELGLFSNIARKSRTPLLDRWAADMAFSERH